MKYPRPQHAHSFRMRLSVRSRLPAIRFFLAGAFLIFAAGAFERTASAEISGKEARIISADSFELAGRVVRLYGVRGPSPEAVCPIGQETWACGQEARWAARNRLGRHWVVCIEQAPATGPEAVAVCHLGGVGGPELNSWLVEKGWVLADPSRPQSYQAAQAAARTAGQGLWRGGFDATLLFP